MEVEKRSIEFIPEDERYGSASRLFSIWFSSNMQVTALIIGALGVAEGLNVFWGIVAVLAGTAFGAIFMAAHSAQGPHLGIPQMIQSRAQFGVLGASVPLGIIVLSYISFTAANAVVMRSAIQAAAPMSDNVAIVLFGLVTLIIAFIGYELIHRIGIWMSILSGLLFLIVAILALQHGLPEGAWNVTGEGFKWRAFVLGFTQAASWSIGFGPYVADYSRYLPKHIKTSSTFVMSYLGQFLGAGLVMCVGAMLAPLVTNLVADPGVSVASLFSENLRWVALVVIVFGVLQINVLNVYSAYMSTATIFTSLKRMSTVARIEKFLVMLAVSVIATAIAILTQYNFQAYFSDILIAQIYFIVPWTAVNLADFYLVRCGVYSVPCIYDEDGQYGRVNWKTLVICAITVVIEIPFMQLSFYEGPIAHLVGTDVTILVSLLVPAFLYYVFNQDILKKVRAEMAAAGSRSAALREHA